MFYDKSYQQVLYQHQATAASAIQQQQQQQQRFDALRDWNSAQPTQQHQQFYAHQWPTATRIPNSAQRPYSGVEQLLMAAMMEGNYPHQNPAFSNHFPPVNHQQSSISRSPPPILAPIPSLHGESDGNIRQQQASRDFLPTGRGLGYRSSQAHTNEQSAIPAITIPVPRNGSELCLYRLLQSANLLDYFGTFVHFGGDDVQQLSDADEEEFMEIMDLVGMTKKPLHIRRLQRALANWRHDQKQDKSDLIDNFKRPSLDTNTSSLVNRCSSPFDSRRSNYTGATIDTSQPATPRSSSSQSFLLIPDETRGESGSFNNATDDNLNPNNNQQEHSYQQQPHILVNAPKRLRLFNPTQMNRNQCKTT